MTMSDDERRKIFEHPMPIDSEQEEIIAIALAIQPLIEAYKRGELSDEEIEFLRGVAQAIWPPLQDVLATIWETFEPILIKLGKWPPKEEE